MLVRVNSAYIARNRNVHPGRLPFRAVRSGMLSALGLAPFGRNWGILRDISFRYSRLSEFAAVLHSVVFSSSPTIMKICTHTYMCMCVYVYI